MREGEEDRVNSTSVWDIVIVGLAAFIPYYSALNDSFVYDDEPAVLYNPDVTVRLLVVLLFYYLTIPLN